MCLHNYSSASWLKARNCENTSCIEITSLHGIVALRNSKNPDGPILQYTADEWIAFLKGAKNGDFDDLV